MSVFGGNTSTRHGLSPVAYIAVERVLDGFCRVSNCTNLEDYYPARMFSGWLGCKYLVMFLQSLGLTLIA